jgi:hypothetical protein
MMKAQIDPKVFAAVLGALVASDSKTAVKYLSPKLVVKATWHNKPRGRNRMEHAVVTFGAPGYKQQRFIDACLTAGEPFPVKKVQLTAWPIKCK